MVFQDIKKSVENVHLDAKIYWISFASLWNSTTVIMLVGILASDSDWYIPDLTPDSLIFFAYEILIWGVEYSKVDALYIKVRCLWMKLKETRAYINQPHKFIVLRWWKIFGHMSTHAKQQRIKNGRRTTKSKGISVISRNLISVFRCRSLVGVQP